MGIPQGKAHTVHMYINLASVPAVGQVFHCIQNWSFERHSYNYLRMLTKNVCYSNQNHHADIANNVVIVATTLSFEQHKPVG